MTLGNIILIIILVALNGFFVAVEFAVVSSRRSRLDIVDPSDRHATRIVRQWLENPAARDRLVAGAQLGITLVSLALGAVGENSFEQWLEPIFENLLHNNSYAFFEPILTALPLIISLTVVTSMHVVLGEQVPKVAALRAPERFALILAPVMNVFNITFKWFVDILDWATRMILELLGLSADVGHSTAVITSEELKAIVSGPESEGVIEEPEREMISAVIEFGDLVVRKVTIPRTEIISVQADVPISEVIQAASENNVTKIPVYEESLEQIIGIVYILDVLRQLASGELGIENVTARDLVRDVLFVPENIPVNSLLYQFRASRTHMAIVLDEFGGTAGIVTLEDLLEEIVGEVHDSFDSEPPTIQTMPDGSILIDGKVLIEEINEEFELELDDPNYDTIAGYILGKLGRIPHPGDMVVVQDNGIKLMVENMDRLRISYVRLTRL